MLVHGDLAWLQAPPAHLTACGADLGMVYVVPAPIHGSDRGQTCGCGSRGRCVLGRTGLRRGAGIRGGRAAHVVFEEIPRKKGEEEEEDQANLPTWHFFYQLSLMGGLRQLMMLSKRLAYTISVFCHDQFLSVVHSAIFYKVVVFCVV